LGGEKVIPALQKSKSGEVAAIDFAITGGIPILLRYNPSHVKLTILNYL
jgi:hypothetical protein